MEYKARHIFPCIELTFAVVIASAKVGRKEHEEYGMS